MIKPPRLQKGMTIGLVSPASGVAEVSVVDRCAEQLRRLGYDVVEGKHARSRMGYLAAADKARADDLNAMFKSRKVDAVMCVRGGYGTPRITDMLDYESFAKNPKVFVGFSDVTMLHLAMLRRSKLVTFNGPMGAFTFADDPPVAFTVESFERTVCNAAAAGSVWQGHDDRYHRVVRPGTVSGRLTGGNLSLVAASLGTRDEIDTRGKILFLEEVDEKPYRLDRMLTQMLKAGKLAAAAGIVFGRNVPDDESAKLEAARGARKGLVYGFPRTVEREWEPILDDVIADRLKPLGIPVMIGLPFGHIKMHATLPLGVKATMDTRSGDLVIQEPAVS